jgi:hypothetical protein
MPFLKLILIFNFDCYKLFSILRASGKLKVARIAIIFGITATNEIVLITALEQIASSELLAALFKINFGHSPL